MFIQKVAVVTGANKGIGYAIVKGLCEKFDGIVFLTSRSTEKGVAAVKKLKESGYNPMFHQLDVTNQDSIDRFQKYMSQNYGGIDILVNNAGRGFEAESTIPLGEQAQSVLGVNYFGIVRLSKALFPLLRDHAQVVNFSSAYGFLHNIRSAALKTKFKNSSLTLDDLNDLMNQYIRDCKENRNVINGWPNTPYALSKIGVTALTFVQQRQMDDEFPNREISVNAVHPGYVSTDLTDNKGWLNVEQGSRAPLYLALKHHNLKGKFVWCDNKVVDWTAASTPPRNDTC